MRRILLFSIFVILLSPVWALLASDIIDVSGKWNMTIIMEDGREIESALSIVQEGEKLTIIRTKKSGEVMEPCEGTIKGDNITWVEIAIMNETEIEILHRGKVKGDQIEGEIELQGSPYYDFRAERIKPKSIPVP